LFFRFFSEKNHHTILENCFTSIQNENHDKMRTCYKGTRVQQMLIRRLLQRDSHKIRSKSSHIRRNWRCVWYQTEFNMSSEASLSASWGTALHFIKFVR